MTAQQLATFQVAGCSSIRQECASTSAPLPVSPQTLAFKEIHVESQQGDVMAVACPAQDVRHQPPGTPLDRYYNYGLDNNDAASTVVKAARRAIRRRARCVGSPVYFVPLCAPSNRRRLLPAHGTDRTMPVHGVSGNDCHGVGGAQLSDSRSAHGCCDSDVQLRRPSWVGNQHAPGLRPDVAWNLSARPGSARAM